MLIKNNFNVSHFIFAIALLCTNAAGESGNGKIPVEIWRGGDDGLTVKLADNLNEIFKASNTFTTGKFGTGESLLVKIKENVNLEDLDGRKKIKYSVSFEKKSGLVLHVSEAGCWADEISECAKDIHNAAVNLIRTAGVKFDSSTPL